MIDHKIETYAIGNALKSRSAADELLALSPEMLSPRGGEILTAMKALQARSVDVTLVTVDTQTNEKYTQYLIDAMDTAYMPSQQPTYIAGIKDTYRRKCLAATLNQSLSQLGDNSVPVEDVVSSLSAKLTTNQSDGAKPLKDALFRFIDKLDKPRGQRLRCGIPLLDEAAGHISGGKLVVIGARPGAGKSALALAIALNAQGPVLFCSLEMSDTEIIGRAVAHLSGLDSGKIAENNLATDDKASLGACYSDLGQRDIFFAERTDTPEKIRIEALRMKRNGGLSAVIVDYLQLMRSGERSENRRVEVGYISRNLKLLALELDCPVIALSQLNRASTMTASKVPSMAELRESGDIEQDADLIVLMYTPPDEPELSDSFEAAGLKLVRFLIEKNRNGRAGAAVDTAFDGSKMRFMRVSEALT